MNELSTAELLELRFMLESSIDMQFQAWMAVTFAVVVASYSGRSHLATHVRVVISIAYLLASYALFARWLTEVDRLEEFTRILLERGISMNPGFGAPFARVSTYALGTLITVVAIFYFRADEPRDDDSPQEQPDG